MRTESRVTGDFPDGPCIIPNKVESICNEVIEVFLWNRFVPFRACLSLQDSDSFDFMNENNKNYNRAKDGNLANDDGSTGLDAHNESGEIDQKNVNENVNMDVDINIYKRDVIERVRGREDENIDVHCDSDDEYVLDGIEGGEQGSEGGSGEGRDPSRKGDPNVYGPDVNTRGGTLPGNDQRDIAMKNDIDTTSIKHGSVCERQSEFHFLIAHSNVEVVNMIMSALADKSYLRAALFLTDSNYFNALDIALSRGENVEFSYSILSSLTSFLIIKLIVFGFIFISYIMAEYSKKMKQTMKNWTNRFMKKFFVSHFIMIEVIILSYFHFYLYLLSHCHV